MVQFSTNEAVSLEKQINKSVPLIHTSVENINSAYEIDKCVQWIKSNNFEKVCLQFPDFLLSDSTEVAMRLQTLLGQVVYIMGDTTYESCCVDYVSAAHVNADAIIHYGPTCFSKSSDNIPCLKVYEKKPLDFHHFRELLQKLCDTEKRTVVVMDVPYLAYLDEIRNTFRTNTNIQITVVDDLETIVLESCNTVFVCDNPRKVLNLKLSFKPSCLYHYDPTNRPIEFINYEQDPRILKRRYFLLEKIKDSTTIGIIIGTLAVRNYLKVLERTKKLIHGSGKKYYVISVGKPTVAKLANFPELDLYVVVSCAMNEIYDSRDFYKPIVTPFDIELALNPNSKDLQFSYDYNSYLPDCNDLELHPPGEASENEPDISLITGKVRSTKSEESHTNSEVALKSEGTVAVNFGAGYLGERSWKGLEQNLGQDEPENATEGRRGIAQHYQNEEEVP